MSISKSVLLSSATVLAVFCLQLSQVSLAQIPVCASLLSDSDNDGWGWENNASCIVVSDTALAPESDSQESSDLCVDSDGDGWGWHLLLQESCRVTGQSTVPVDLAVENTDSSLPLLTQPASVRPYPPRDLFRIKALQPDFWADKTELLQAGIEGVAVNFVWASWEPDDVQAPCPNSMHRYANRCYRIEAKIDAEVRYWSRQGKNVTAILWGVPEWARDDGCINTLPGRSIFCSTDSAGSFGDFAGMLADRYRAANANGLITDFVIHNEVNAYEWYNHRCSPGQNCDVNAWIRNYAESYNAAYDSIKRANATAKVFVPLTHHYASIFDNPNADRPLISVQTFLRGLNNLTGSREWKLAYHPYNKSLHSNGFSSTDWPHVTMGNIGVLSGWLRSEFPLQPASWEIYLTEHGYNSMGTNATEQGQASDLCGSFHNALATPGIENYIYHRMRDHLAELDAGVGLGLRGNTNRAKPAWAVWANASGRSGSRSGLSCGFENLPYTKVSTYTHANQVNRTSSRLVDGSYQLQSTVWLMRNHVEDAVMIYECSLNGGSYLSHDAACGGRLSLGPVGYAYRNPAANRISIYSCESNSGNRFISNDNSCGSAGSPFEFLGYSVRR